MGALKNRVIVVGGCLAGLACTIKLAVPDRDDVNFLKTGLGEPLEYQILRSAPG
jgi:thioredoxin reductase